MEVARPFRENDPVEAVADATQLAALSFAAAVHGYLAPMSSGTRVVMHRAISRGGMTFLQQASPYAGRSSLDHSASGRIMDLDRGIVGYALKNKLIAHTKPFDSEEELFQAIQTSMKKVGDDRNFSDVARSYLAVPMIGADGETATVLYSDSFTSGLFAPRIVEAVRDMCAGFCIALDQLSERPFAYVENFSRPRGEPTMGNPDVYDGVQQLAQGLQVPRYQRLSYFNLESKRYS